MRLFVSVDISKEVKDYLLELQKQIPLDTGKFTMTKPEQCHITMKFIGEADELDAKEKLKSVKFKSFKLKTSKFGFFPGNDFIKVFWLGLQESEELNKLAQDVRKAIPEIKDDFPFSPHVTIARVKYLGDKEKFKQFVSKLEVKEIEWEVNSFQLMKSDLTLQGPVYEVVHDYK